MTSLSLLSKIRYPKAITWLMKWRGRVNRDIPTNIFKSSATKILISIWIWKVFISNQRTKTLVEKAGKS